MDQTFSSSKEQKIDKRYVCENVLLGLAVSKPIHTHFTLQTLQSLELSIQLLLSPLRLWTTNSTGTPTDNFWAEIGGFLQCCGCSGWCCSGTAKGATQHSFRSVWSRHEHPSRHHEQEQRSSRAKATQTRGFGKDCSPGRLADGLVGGYIHMAGWRG